MYLLVYIFTYTFTYIQTNTFKSLSCVWLLQEPGTGKAAHENMLKRNAVPPPTHLKTVKKSSLNSLPSHTQTQGKCK